jgi:hypothetical protein
MRSRLISTLVLLLLSISATAAQAPQQAPQEVDIGAKARQERMLRLFRLMDDPLFRKQVELTQVATEESRARQRETNTCAVPDGTRIDLNAEIFFDGRRYRCVEIFEMNDAPGMANAPLKRRNAGLVRVQPVP